MILQSEEEDVQKHCQTPLRDEDRTKCIKEWSRNRKNPKRTGFAEKI